MTGQITAGRRGSWRSGTTRRLGALLGLFLALPVLGGCGILRSDYQRTQAVIPGTSWNADEALVSVLRDPEGAWWRDFGDETLDALIARGLAGSTEIATAASALRSAALRAQVEDLSLLPTPSAHLSSSKRFPHHGGSVSSSSSSLEISYEADLFGKLAADRDAARFTYEATLEDFLAVKLSLSRRIASAYWTLAYARDALRSEERNIEEYRDIVRLAELKHREGAISLYELNRAKTQRLTSMTAAAGYRDQILAAEDELLALLSLNSREELPVSLDDLTLEGRSVPGIMPGIPADLMSNRPDLRSAEKSLKAKLASWDRSRLAFFPSLTLTGGLGAGSDELFGFFDNPVLSLAGSLTAPFLNYRNLSLNRDISREDYEKAVADFEDRWRRALFEVKELLQTVSSDRERCQNTSEALALAEENDRRYRLQYDSGGMSYGDFLDNRRTLRTARLEHYRQLMQHLEDTAKLYQALGGAQK